MSLNPITGHHESSAMPQRVRDVLGRLKVSIHQNVYEADFEYGPQPLRWEAVVQTNDGSSSITAIPSSGGVRMRVGTAIGDVTIRQSRPYHRYQPGKTMFMATGCNFGTALAGNIQRVGFFDDANGVFFEQGNAYVGNPYGMYVVVRTDVGGVVNETRVGLDQWNGDLQNIRQLNFSNIQMFWIEYGWYGAGATRFGFWINGEPVIAHQIGWGNYSTASPGSPGQQTPWARTGNLPVRYEQRNLTGTSQINDMYHWGVSVIVEGQRDEQRGFTYSYGLPNTTPTVTLSGTGNNRVPVLTVRGRQMGTQEFGNVYGRNDLGSSPTATATIAAAFTGYISGTTLTVVAVTNGTVAVGGTLLGTGVATSSSANGMLQPFTTVIANIAGSGAGSTWTVTNSQTLGSAASPITFTMAGTSMTITGTPLTVNQWQGRNIYFPGQGATSSATTTGSITSGSLTITGLASMTNIYVGSKVTGTGVNNNPVPTFVTSINASASSITVSLPMIATNGSASLTFSNIWGQGAMGRITYNSTSTFYFCDPVLQNAIPTAPTILTSPVTQSYASGGASGAYTVLVGANTGITVGQSVTGTGIAPGAQVTIVNGTTITFNLPNTAQVSGTLTFNTGYVIGLSNRGQLLPRRLYVSQSANTQVLVEVIASTPTNPTVLTNPNFVALQYLGSVYSFAERDVSASAVSGGEVVFAFVLSSGSGVQDIDFSYFFPLYNNVKGSGIDTLTIAISNPSGTAPVVGANLICQEAMS